MFTDLNATGSGKTMFRRGNGGTDAASTAPSCPGCSAGVDVPSRVFDRAARWADPLVDAMESSSRWVLPSWGKGKRKDIALSSAVEAVRAKPDGHSQANDG